MTLFEIDKALYEFEFEIDEETGEILNAEELDNLKMEREKKIEGVGLWYKNLTAEAEAVKAEKNAMAEREKRLKNKAESLKRYLSYALQGEKFNTPKVAMSFRKSTSVEVDEGANLPENYVRVKTVVEPDKKMLKEALDNGEIIEGARLVEKNNISIK